MREYDIKNSVWYQKNRTKNYVVCYNQFYQWIPGPSLCQTFLGSSRFGPYVGSTKIFFQTNVKWWWNGVYRQLGCNFGYFFRQVFTDSCTKSLAEACVCIVKCMCIWRSICEHYHCIINMKEKDKTVKSTRDSQQMWNRIIFENFRLNYRKYVVKLKKTQTIYFFK